MCTEMRDFFCSQVAALSVFKGINIADTQTQLCYLVTHGYHVLFLTTITLIIVIRDSKT